MSASNSAFGNALLRLAMGFAVQAVEAHIAHSTPTAPKAPRQPRKKKAPAETPPANDN